MNENQITGTVVAVLKNSILVEEHNPFGEKPHLVNWIQKGIGVRNNWYECQQWYDAEKKLRVFRVDRSQLGEIEKSISYGTTVVGTPHEDTLININLKSCDSQ